MTTKNDLTNDDRAREILADAMNVAAAFVSSTYEWGASVCESPIERVFLAQILHPQIANDYDTKVEVVRPPSGQVAHAVPPPFSGIYVYPQIEIGEYRVDFLIIALGVGPGPSSQIIVECDGHDFHERTKFQAQRDKSRDRTLMSQGYKVLRYTGSELYKDPDDSVREALDILLDIR